MFPGRVASKLIEDLREASRPIFQRRITSNVWLDRCHPSRSGVSAGFGVLGEPTLNGAQGEQHLAAWMAGSSSDLSVTVHTRSLGRFGDYFLLGSEDTAQLAIPPRLLHL